MSKFLKVIVNLFLVCAILVAGAILVPPLLGVSTTVVDSSSMDTNLPIGSITYSQEVRAANVSAGDKILDETDAMAYAYVVESTDASAGNCVVTDMNASESEPKEIALRNTALKIVVTIPLIGYVMIAMRSVEGLIIIGLVILFVIILFILSELWKKAGDEEEDPEEDETQDEDVRVDSPDDRAEEEAQTEKEQKVYPEFNAELTADELAHLVSEIHNNKVEELQKPVEETAELSVEEIEETEAVDSVAAEPVESNDDSFVPVTRPSKEDILKKARAAGEEPEVTEYGDITIFDYTDII